MEEVVTSFLSYKSILLTIAVVILTFFIRRIVETAVPSAKKAAHENDPAKTYLNVFAEWWNKVILYAIPVLVGLVLAITVKELAPESLKTGGLSIYGAVVGWFSSFLYKVFRKVVQQKTGLNLPSASTAPPPGEDEDAADDSKDPPEAAV